MVYAAANLPENWFDWPNPPGGGQLDHGLLWQELPVSDLAANCPGFPVP
jgi:hypothetical protein